jgi:hypothetical protein
MRRPMLVATLLAVAAGSLGADVAPTPRGVARNVEPYGENVPVTMAWEEVDLVPAADRLDVTAVFGLKNIGTADVSLDIGFPELRGQPIRDFRVTVDSNGKPVAVKDIEPVKLKDRNQKPASLPEWVGFRGYEKWHSWRMDFPKGVERKVTVKYWVAPTVQPESFGDKNIPQDLRDKTAYRVTGYLLHTGSLWSGPIGRAVVRIHYSNAFPKTLVRGLNPPWRHYRDKSPVVSPWKYDEKARTDTLVLTDVKPTWQNDIEIGYKTSTIAEEIDAQVRALKDGVPFGPYDVQRLAFQIESEGAKAVPEADRRSKLLYVYDRLTADIESNLESARRRLESWQRMEKDSGPLVSYAEEHQLYAPDCLKQRALRALLDQHRSAGDAAKARAVAERYDKVLADAEAYWKSKAEKLEKVAVDPQPAPKHNPHYRTNAQKQAAECREKLAAAQKERLALAPVLKGNGKVAAINK